MPSKLILGLSAGLLAVSLGCAPPVDERTSNQGGGSLLSIAAKVAGDSQCMPIGTFTPDEWQIAADQLPQLLPMIGQQLPAGLAIPTLEDAQAQAITDFLAAISVTCVSELEALGPAIESGEIIVPAALIELAESLGAEF